MVDKVDIVKRKLRVPGNVATLKGMGWRYLKRQANFQRELEYISTHWKGLASTFTTGAESGIVVIPVFDNPTYTMNMCQQLRNLEIGKVIILDNRSTTRKMNEVLVDEQSYGSTVLRLPENFGPRFLLRHQRLLDLMPKTFVLTDPDLQLNPKFPEDATDVMGRVSDAFRVGKVGVALDISQPDLLTDTKITIGERDLSCVEWEERFWRFPLVNSFGLDLYAAAVDTTFAVYNLDFFRPSDDMYEGVRVAGDFTAVHLPWLKDATAPDGELNHYRTNKKNGAWV